MTAQVAKRIAPYCAEVCNKDLSSFIDVLTESYGLDRQGAEEIFFADPYFSLPNKRALWLDDEMASCLTLVERDVRFGDQVTRVSGICGVATRPEFRGRGYASELMIHSIEELESRKVAFALLNPVSADLYHSLGFEFVAHSDRLTFSPRQLPGFPVSDQVRPIVKRDIVAMAMLYDNVLSDQPLALVRDIKRWTFLLKCQKEAVVFEPRPGSIEGYLIFDRIPADGPDRISLRVLEMCSATRTAQRALIAFLANQPASRIVVEGTTEMHSLNGLMELNYIRDAGTATIERMPNTMARTANFTEAVTAAVSGAAGNLNALGEATIRLQMRSLGLISQERSCVIGISRNTVTVLSDDLPESSVDHVLTGDVGAWTRTLLGTLSGESALQQSLLSSSTPLAAEAASALFPLRRPYLSLADFF